MYQRITKSRISVWEPKHKDIVADINADLVASSCDRKSTLECCLYVGNPCSWIGKKQNFVVRSSNEHNIRLWLSQHVNKILNNVHGQICDRVKDYAIFPVTDGALRIAVVLVLINHDIA